MFINLSSKRNSLTFKSVLPIKKIICLILFDSKKYTTSPFSLLKSFKSRDEYAFKSLSILSSTLNFEELIGSSSRSRLL